MKSVVKNAITQGITREDVESSDKKEQSIFQKKNIIKFPYFRNILKK